MTYVNEQQYTIKRTLLRSSIKRFINAVGRDFNIYFLNFVLMFDQIIYKKIFTHRSISHETSCCKYTRSLNYDVYIKIVCFDLKMKKSNT